ncbi:ArnT family glycosyltransferase [Peredibacter sp. HCB2-198]|uniref:ArnT family glycosyltransferase n=1 Tax=Peredibacter sp. HCB2-198 TaxID=3383025 RepID=UPI0038B454CB
MTSDKRYDLSVISLLILALAVRLCFLFYGKSLEDQIWSDMREYTVKADMIINGEWNAMHFFQSIGYSFVIIFFKKNFEHWGKALAYFQGIISFLTVWPIFRTATEAFGKKVGLITLLLVALNLPWIVFINLALPETIFTFLMALLAWFSYRIVYSEGPTTKYAVGWALSFLLAFWLKGTHVFLMPLFLLGLFAIKRWKAIPNMVTISAIFIIGVCLHGVLTYNTIGKFQLSSSTGGLNFIEGKCPIKNNHDSVGYSFLSPVYFQMGLFQEKKWGQPFSNSSYFMKEGFKCIKKDPLVLLQSFEAIPFLFMGNTLWPINQMSYSALARLYEQIFAVLLITGLALFLVSETNDPDRLRGLVVWGLPVLSVFLCVYVFKSEMRYRIPFDVWFIPIAVAGWIKKGPVFTGPRILENVYVSADSNICSVQTNVAWNELDVRVKEHVTSKRDT